MREAQKRTESQLNHLAELLQKIANQSPVNPQVQAQPLVPSPLPSQPLPNPKGGINAVQVEMDNEEEDEAEDEEGENDWLYELLKELENSNEFDDEEEDENIEEESEEESDEEEEESELAEEEDINDRDKGKIFFINTLFKEKKNEEEIPIKCEDPGPCLVTCKIRGVSIPDCLCDPWACGNIMPFEIGQLTIPIDFHVIKPKKVERGGRPQVLLGRPFLKTAEFKLIYYDEIFTFSVGNANEIFHLTPPPKPRKKGIYQLQIDKGKVRERSPKKRKKAVARVKEKSRGKARDVEGSSDNSSKSEGKKKKISSNLE
ncbi:hypothetical protein PIB30_045782 [Stylosanthes scabra]|uniref:Uncharacterized protein n=1 Tax=Stylosanthes scabra TaxID=79078 RepID=A0ABU6WEC8_9FABA|nr:hypothetical protein [Stylosanthes scabra]